MFDTLYNCYKIFDMHITSIHIVIAYIYITRSVLLIVRFYVCIQIIIPYICNAFLLA